MPLISTAVGILTRLKPSFVGLKNKVSAIGARPIDLFRACSTTISPVSRTKTGIRKLAARFPVLKSWQFWVTALTAASFLFAILSFWTSLESSQYAKWTAHKDFVLLCMEKETRNLSLECPAPANLSLPAPPSFHDTRDEDDNSTIRHSFGDFDPSYLYHDTCGFRDPSQTSLFLPWVDAKFVCSSQESIFIEDATHRLLAPGQCRTYTTFWVTIQVAVVISAVFYGGTFPSWPRRPTSARDSIEASRQLLKDTALERSGWIWRARSRQSILLVCQLSLHRLLCSDGNDFVNQRIATVFSGYSQAGLLLPLIPGQFLSTLFLPFFYIIFLRLQVIFPSQTFSTKKGDLDTFVNEMIYLSCLPFLSFVLTSPDDSIPKGTWWLPFLVCMALKPSDIEHRLHERYEEWIEDTRKCLKICSVCGSLEGYTHDYLGALQKCWKRGLSLQYREQAIHYIDWIEDAPEISRPGSITMEQRGFPIHTHAGGWQKFQDRDSFLKTLECIICLQIKERHSGDDEDDGPCGLEKFAFGYWALPDRSIWDTFCFAPYLLGRVVPWVLWFYSLRR